MEYLTPREAHQKRDATAKGTVGPFRDQTHQNQEHQNGRMYSPYIQNPHPNGEKSTFGFLIFDPVPAPNQHWDAVARLKVKRLNICVISGVREV